MTRYDAAVVGAGPAGSAVALRLARSGLRVALLDRARFPRAKPCAEYLSPEAGRMLAGLGVLPAIEADNPARLAGMRVVSPDGTSFTGRFAGARAFGPFREYGLALPRTRLDAHLARAAVVAGAILLEGSLVETVEREVTGTLALGVRAGRARSLVRAPLVIGADGLGSRVARWMGVARRGGRRRVALVAHVEGARDLGGVGEMHVGRGAYVGLASVGGGLTNVAAVAEVSHLPPGNPTRRWDELLDRFPTVRERLRGAVRVTPVGAAGPFARWTTRATADGALLVGDAADFYDPFTGEGIYAALRGAELAAARAWDALATGRLGHRDLAAYDRDRRRAFGGKWRLERAIGYAVATPRVLNHVARRLARRTALADLLVGATGDFVPARAVLRPRVAARLVW